MPFRYLREGGNYLAITSGDVTSALGFTPATPVSGTTAIFATRTLAAAANISASLFVLTAGYAAAGDFGGALYKKAGGSTTGGFQSADGQWWSLAEATVSPQMFGAAGDGVTDDTTAVQNAINFMNTNHGGGTVFFPAATYLVASGITCKGGVRLVGAARLATVLKVTTDTPVVTFDATCNYGGMEELFIVGYQVNTAVQNAVNFANGVVNNYIRHCIIWGGNAALNVGGSVDCVFEDIFPLGYVYCILSIGANWYKRVKMDAPGGVLPGQGTLTAGFFQGVYPFAGVAENHFEQCDFSGTYTNSISVNDGSGTVAISVFAGCVTSAPITVSTAKFNMFSHCEIGSTSFIVGTTPSPITGCIATGSPITVSGAGKIVSGCSNIT